MPSQSGVPGENPDGFPTPYSRWPGLFDYDEPRNLIATVMEDGRIAVMVQYPDDEGPRVHSHGAVLFDRDHFGVWMQYMQQWWLREQTEPLVEVYQRVFEHMERDLQGSEDG